MTKPLINLGDKKTLLWMAKCLTCPYPIVARSGKALEQAKADHLRYGCRVAIDTDAQKSA